MAMSINFKKVIDKLVNQYKNGLKNVLNGFFIHACANKAIDKWNRNLDIVKYLMSNSNLKKHANIHTREDAGFKYACNNGNLDIINFLIFDMNIKKTKWIEEYLSENKENRFTKTVEELFQIRYESNAIRDIIETNLIKNNKLNKENTIVKI